MKRQATTPLAEPSTKKINPGPLEINTKGTKKYHEGTARYPIRKALLQKKMGDMLTQIRAAEQGFEELLAATSGSYQRNREEIEAHKKSIRAAYDALPDAERTPERQKKFKEDLDAARYWQSPAAAAFYKQRNKYRKIITGTGMFWGLCAPEVNLVTYQHPGEDGEVESDPFVSMLMLYHWNQKSLDLVLDRVPLGRLSDIRAGRYANGTLKLGGVRVKVRAEGDNVYVSCKDRSINLDSYLPSNNFEVSAYARKEKECITLHMNYCDRNAMHETSLNYMCHNDKFRGWLLHLGELHRVLSLARDHQWECYDYYHKHLFRL